jgi:hypothetical protein
MMEAYTDGLINTFISKDINVVPSILFGIKAHFIGEYRGNPSLPSLFRSYSIRLYRKTLVLSIIYYAARAADSAVIEML